MLRENEVSLNEFDIYNEYDDKAKEDTNFSNKGYNGWYECRQRYIMNRKKPNEISFFLIYDADASPYGDGFSQLKDKNNFFHLFHIKHTYPNKKTEICYSLYISDFNQPEFTPHYYRKTEIETELFLDSLFVNGEYVFVKKVREKNMDKIDLWFHSKWGFLFTFNHTNLNMPIKVYLSRKFNNQNTEAIAMYIDSIQLKYYHRKPFRMEGRIFSLQDSIYRGQRLFIKRP